MDSPGRLPGTPRRKRVIDRFIPHREGVNLETAFSVANSVRQPAPPIGLFDDSPPPDPLDTKVKETQDARQIYSNLLKSEMFGEDSISLTSASSMNSLHSLTKSNSMNGNSVSMLTGSSSFGGVGGAGLASAFGSNSGSNGSAGNGSIGTSAGLSYGGGGGLTGSNSFGGTSSMGKSRSSLSLPTSPRKPRPTHTSGVGSTLRYSPHKLIRSESDLSDISMGGGSVNASGSGLRPESLDYLLQPKPQQRVVRATPLRVLDAPGFVDDFYLNLVHWGVSNRLAVGLGRRVYVWDARNGEVSQVTELASGELVTSVAWMDSGEHIAVGTSQGSVKIVDAITTETLRTMSGHTERASSLAWNDHILSSGSRDHTILHRDCRIKEHFIARLQSHRGEVCGLKWNTDLQQLASGGNDNKLKIWSGVHNSSVSNAFSSSSTSILANSSPEPLYEFDEHTSAVKGIAWSPHQRGLLASGGGFCDRKIWFWNTLNGKSVNSIETGSQVCSLEWSPRAKELISSQGSRYSDVVVWKYPTMQPIARLRGHAYRVLHMALSPDGRSLATGAGDETLRLWSLYDDDDPTQETSIAETFQQLR